MLRVAASLTLVATFVWVLGACDDGRQQVTEERLISHSWSTGMTLDVATEVGGIRVLRDPKRHDVEIKAILTATAFEDEGVARRIPHLGVAIHTTSKGVLMVRPRFPVRRREGESCALVIRVPGMAGVVLDSAHGRLTIDGLNGSARLSSEHGGITVRSHEGEVVARSRFGSIEMDGVRGHVDARSDHGSLDLRDVGGETSAVSTHGSIRYEPAAKNHERFTLDSAHATVRCLINREARGRVECTSEFGRVRVSTRRRRGTLTGDDHQQELRLTGHSLRSKARSTHGSVRIEFQR